MFLISWEITVLFFGFLTAVVFAVAVLLALVLNATLKTSLGSHLVSSGLVGVIAFMVALAGLIFLPGSLVWYNTEPQNLRTMLWEHSLGISGILALLCLAFWQLIVRRKHLTNAHHSDNSANQRRG